MEENKEKIDADLQEVFSKYTRDKDNLIKVLEEAQSLKENIIFRYA